jgi:hypothetical protein
MIEFITRTDRAPVLSLYEVPLNLSGDVIEIIAQHPDSASK